MSNEANILDDLGLTSPAGETSEVQNTPVAEATEAPLARTELKIVGEVITGGGLLPAVQRGFGAGKRGSKYPFEDLEAPVKNEAGEVTEYKFFTIRLDAVENADGTKLTSAIRAAVAQQNKSSKEEGRVEKYVARQVIENGEYVGSSVYRVDDTLEAAE